MSARPDLDRPCLGCYKEETETFIGFRGDAEWVTAGFMAAADMSFEEAEKLFFWYVDHEGIVPFFAPGQFGMGKALRSEPVEWYQISIAVCPQCAGKMKYGPREAIPVYQQQATS